MESIARGQLWVPHDNFLGARSRGHIDGENLIRDSEHGVEGGLDRVAAVDSYVAVQDFLEHLGVRDQTRTIAGQLF